MNISRLGQIDMSDLKYVEDRTDRRVEHGDVLFNNTNSPELVGKTAYVTSREPLAYSNHMTRLRYDASTIDGRFLAYQLHGFWAAGYFKAICSNHVNQASVASRRLAQVEISVAPLGEQRRIIEILEDHLSHLDAAAKYLEAAQHRVRSYVGSLIESTIGQDHQSQTLADISIGSGYGTSTKCVVNGPGLSVVRIPNVVDGQVDLTDTKRVADPEVDVSSFILREDDLLIVRTNGSRELIGKSAVVQAEVTAAFASYLIRFRIDQSRALPRWVSAVLGSPRLRVQIESLAASSAGQYNLSLGKLGPLRIPLPELDVQRELVARIDDARVAARRLASVCKASSRRSNTLRRGLLQTAFSGQLTGRATNLDRAEESIA